LNLNPVVIHPLVGPSIRPSEPESASGILPTWQKRVRTCLKHVRTTYVQCYSTSLLRTRVVHVHTFLKMYVHVHTFWKKYKHVRTVYVHGTYMFIYLEV
jgi:hypothetical protein